MSEYRKCPMCGEELSMKEIICPFCGYDLLKIDDLGKDFIKLYKKESLKQREKMLEKMDKRARRMIVILRYILKTIMISKEAFEIFKCIIEDKGEMEFSGIVKRFPVSHTNPMNAKELSDYIDDSLLKYFNDLKERYIWIDNKIWAKKENEKKKPKKPRTKNEETKKLDIIHHIWENNDKK